MSEIVEGGCTCGAMRYRIQWPPMIIHCCHCMQCQRSTGSAFVVNAVIETDRIEIVSGHINITPGPSESGRPHDIHRCAACATALWSDYGRRPSLRFLRVGTLDDPSMASPDVHIFTRSMAKWLALPSDAQAFEIYYDMTPLWPPDSLARRRAILGEV